MPPDQRIKLAPLGFFTAALTLFIIHLCWLIASSQGFIDWCNPYWADCVSISKTGRNGIAYFVFKGGIISACVLQGMIWQLCRYWLLSLGTKKGGALPYLGWAAAVALIIYTLSLGHSGDTFRLLRRFGVILYIGLSYICFISVESGLLQSHLKSAGKAMLIYSKGLLAVALFSLVLDAAMGDEYDRIENAFEWWLLGLLNLQLFWLAALWRYNGAHITVASRN